LDIHGNASWETLLRDVVVEHEIVSVTDAEGRIIAVSDAFCELSGFERDELLGKSHAVVSSSYHSHEDFQRVWTTVLGGQVWRGEFCNRSKHGEEYWVSARLVPTRDADGQIRLFSFQTDITEYKRVQRALVASEERLRFFMENIDESAVVIAEGRIIDLSDVGLAMFRVTREACLGGSPHSS
jgi:two-component system, sensor histidine kinase and response regulator